MGPFVILGHPASELLVMHGGGDLPWLPINAAVCLQVQKYLCIHKTLLDCGLLLLYPLLQVVDPSPALSELAVLFFQCIAAMESFLPAVDDPSESVDLSLDAEVPKGIEGPLNVWVKGVLEGFEGGEDEVGGCWCMEGESMEGLQVDRLIVAHGSYEHGLPQVEPHAQILSCHLIPPLILECEVADVLVWFVGVSLRAQMIPVVVASWRQMIADFWVCASNCFGDQPHHLTHWVICGEGGYLVGRG